MNLALTTDLGIDSALDHHAIQFAHAYLGLKRRVPVYRSYSPWSFKAYYDARTRRIVLIPGRCLLGVQTWEPAFQNLPHEKEACERAAFMERVYLANGPF